MSSVEPLVLVLDDDEDGASLLGLALQRRGYRAVVAGTCAGAREQFAGGGVDALVVDVVLPDGSGHDFVASLTPRPRAVVVLSGFCSDEDRDRSRAAGADAHLAKPVGLDQLVATLDELLGRAG